jgi:hypothetical protein
MHHRKVVLRWMLRVKAFWKACVLPLSRMSLLFPALNAFYFGLVLVGALHEHVPGLVVYELPTSGIGLDVSANPALMITKIFLFNLFISGFFLTTLSGLVLFVLPFVVVFWRALLWGTFVAQLPSPKFVAALPTLVLEGEAYVVAAVAGVILGLSWLKPDWAFKGEGLSRREAFRAALKECAHLYALVVLLLSVGAVVETVTIAYVFNVYK